MVKKRLANGEPCAKCLQAEQMLKTRGLWDRIDDVVWADELDPNSDGMLLGKKHGVDVAPFFIVEGDDGEERIYESSLKFVKKELAAPVSPSTSKEAPSTEDLAAVAEHFAERDPAEIVRWGLERYGDLCTIAFSGAEDVVLVDMASKTGLPFSVLSLDTGRLHPKTYRFLEKVRKHYGIEIEFVYPQAQLVQDLVRKKGLYSFYEDGHTECCSIRKVEPLRRALQQYDAWMTGQRHDQSPATRSDLVVVEKDDTHEGKSGALSKLNPLAFWSSDQVWQYIRENDVPFNDLHERGYKSIGCEPCTRATLPGEHERAGRWWWEEATKRECGLHTG